jgi:hypothetical protein
MDGGRSMPNALAAIDNPVGHLSAYYLRHLVAHLIDRDGSISFTDFFAWNAPATRTPLDDEQRTAVEAMNDDQKGL